MTATVPALRPARLPLPATAGVDAGQWRVLVEAIFPNAKSSDSVLLALDYCKARGLDVMKKPVHIVPVWNSLLGRETETIWPSINEIQVTAARTKQWAGMDAPAWGPDVQHTFKGRRKGKDGWKDTVIDVTFPEWCAVTVYRMIDGNRCAFTEPVYWMEAYARVGGGILPNDMWCKRPHGQLHKVAKAASLRAAFPEEGDYSDVEMEGQTVGGDLAPVPAAAVPADNWTPPPDQMPPDDFDQDTGEVGPRELPRNEGEELREWALRLLDAVRSSPDIPTIEAWIKNNEAGMTTLLRDAPKIHTQLMAQVGKHRVKLTTPKEEQGEPADDNPS